MTEEIDYARLAAYIDGEGAVQISKKKKDKTHPRESFSLKIRIGITDKRLINWLETEFGGNVNETTTRNDKWKTVFIWDVFGKDVYKLLVRIRKYLIIKGEQADVGMAFWYETQRNGSNRRGGRPKWKIERQTKYYHRMKELNMRGK